MNITEDFSPDADGFMILSQQDTIKFVDIWFQVIIRLLFIDLLLQKNNWKTFLLAKYIIVMVGPNFLQSSWNFSKTNLSMKGVKKKVWNRNIFDKLISSLKVLKWIFEGIFFLEFERLFISNLTFFSFVIMRLFFMNYTRKYENYYVWSHLFFYSLLLSCFLLGC